MKLSLKHIYICSLIGLGASTLASCNDFLDREPITNVTPEAYFTTVDQVGAYVINYYSYLQNSRQQSLYHRKCHSNMQCCHSKRKEKYHKDLSVNGRFHLFMSHAHLLHDLEPFLILIAL